MLHPDGTFNYTPELLPPGSLYVTDSFSYAVTDGALTSDPVTVAIHITTLPLPHDDSYILNSDGSLTVSPSDGVLANDLDPNPSRPGPADGATGPQRRTQRRRPDPQPRRRIHVPPGRGAARVRSLSVTSRSHPAPGRRRRRRRFPQALVTLWLAGQPTAAIQEVDYGNVLTLVNDQTAAPYSKRWTADKVVWAIGG